MFQPGRELATLRNFCSPCLIWPFVQSPDIITSVYIGIAYTYNLDIYSVVVHKWKLKQNKNKTNKKIVVSYFCGNATWERPQATLVELASVHKYITKKTMVV